MADTGNCLDNRDIVRYVSGTFSYIETLLRQILFSRVRYSRFGSGLCEFFDEVLFPL